MPGSIVSDDCYQLAGKEQKLLSESHMPEGELLSLPAHALLKLLLCAAGKKAAQASKLELQLVSNPLAVQRWQQELAAIHLVVPAIIYAKKALSFLNQHYLELQ